MKKALREELERNIARAMVRVGVGGFVQMDDATRDGAVQADPAHQANAVQNSLGSFLPTLARKGYLISTGRSVASRATWRKGGKQSLWEVTEEGVLWAKKNGGDEPRKRFIPRQ